MQVKFGYQFNPIFGLEANLGAGIADMGYDSYQKNFYLGKQDAYIYYPYTKIDGSLYLPDPNNNVGAQGKNIVTADAVPFSKLRSRAMFIQSSLNANINLTPLFISYKKKETFLELWLKPGLYLSHYKTKVYDKETNKVIAPKINQPLTFGAGGDVLVRFNLGKHLALDLSNRVIWQMDHTISGVRNSKKAYDGYTYQAAVGLTYKFRQKAEKKACPKQEFALKPVPKTPKFSFYYPTMVELPAIKYEIKQIEAKLQYPVNKTFIVPELADNKKELAKIKAEIADILNNQSYKVASIKVEGFASPEGPYKANISLAQGRAESLVGYLLENSAIERNVISLGRMSENWSGLEAVLKEACSKNDKNCKLVGKTKMLELLQKESNREKVKKQIKTIKGYKHLLGVIYPSLRKSVIVVKYAVKEQTVDLKSLYARAPQQMSAEQLYSLAMEYGVESKQAQGVLKTLTTNHPQSDITLHYMGVSALMSKDYAKAKELLSKIKNHSIESINALGVAYAQSGEKEKAREVLRTIAAQSIEARLNLLEL